jgi:phosphatidylglycerophosphatase A
MTDLNIRKELITALATGIYAGYIPFASGTFGTVVGVPFCYVLSLFDPVVGLVYVAAFCTCAIWLAGEAEKIFGSKDSGLIVVDEMAGMLVTMYLIPWNFTNLALGFLLFRIADIVKPYPIRRLETALPGGFGVVGDDLLAGVYANMVLRAIIFFL